MILETVIVASIRHVAPDAASVKKIPYQVRDDESYQVRDVENNSSLMGLCRAKRLSIVL